MRITDAGVPNEHKVYLDSRGESIRVARAMGLWRFSGLKLLAATFTASDGAVGLRVDTVNLRTIDETLDPSSLELRKYLGELTIPQPDLLTEALPELNQAISVA
jgi:hypothetical protein